MEILSYAFMQKALIVSVLASIAAGTIGTLVNVNRMSSLAGSIAHASFGGLGLAYILGLNPLVGATIFAVLASLVIGAISGRSAMKTETAMAAVWATGMAVGLVLIKISGTYAADLMSWLFGSILAVNTNDIIYAVLLNLLVISVITILYKEFLAVAYDHRFAMLQGVPVGLVRTIFLVLTALTAVLLMRITGLIMVIAMLSIPPAIAEMFTTSLRKMMVLASILSAVFSVGGLFLAYALDLPPGSVVILLAAACYAAALLVERLRSHWV